MKLWDRNWTRLREFIIWGVIAVVVGAIVATAIYVLVPQLGAQSTLRLGDGIFRAHIIDAPPETDAELGYSDKLDSELALIIPYTQAEAWPINVSKLTVPLDIVWLNADKEVVYIVKNTPGEATNKQIYTPNAVARYVVELAGGTVDEKSIKIGAEAVFDEYSAEQGEYR